MQNAYLNIAQNIQVYSTLTHRVGMRVIFMIPYESVEAVTQLNCFDFGAFCLQLFAAFPRQHLAEFLDVVFSLA